MNAPTTMQPLDAVLINAAMQATTNVMSVMANTQVLMKEVKAEADYKCNADITAMINISGAQGEGMMALSFSIELADLVVNRMLGTQAKCITSDDRSDVLGELINMISGSTKSALSQQHNTLYQLSLPIVVQGDDHIICTPIKDMPYLVMVFQAEEFTFSLRVAFKKY